VKEINRLPLWYNNSYIGGFNNKKTEKCKEIIYKSNQFDVVSIGWGREISLLYDGWVYSRVENTATCVCPYINTMVNILTCLRNPPKRILLGGGGAGTAGIAMNIQFPGCKMIAVEISSEVINIGKEYFGANSIPGFTYIQDDLSLYINNVKKDEFDVIMLDCYEGINVPQCLDEAFIVKCFSLLPDNGAIVFNMPHNQRVLRSVYKTLCEQGLMGDWVWREGSTQ